MTSKAVALLLADLGVTKSHSRPHVSNDNPYSEAQFKTLKYRPDFPDRFGSLEHGRSFCGDFFRWYNHEHHHVGLGLFTPHDVHFGLAAAKREQRALVLAGAFAKNPERFPNGRPSPRSLPTAAWINPAGENTVAPTVERGRDRRSWGNLEGRYRGRTPREPTPHARGPMHGGCSVNSRSECLNVVDRFRPDARR